MTCINTHTAIQDTINELYKHAAQCSLNIQTDDLVSVKQFHNGAIVLTLTGQKKDRNLRAIVLDHHQKLYTQPASDHDLDIYRSTRHAANNTQIEFNKPQKRSLLTQILQKIRKS